VDVAEDVVVDPNPFRPATEAEEEDRLVDFLVDFLVYARLGFLAYNWNWNCCSGDGVWVVVVDVREE